MRKTAYGKPVSIKDGKTEILNLIEAKKEIIIQNLVFEYPECLPISDIDESFNPAFPVCTELNTPVGPLDVFMITPTGEIIIVETKLWRNPEARRTVVAQILDYAKELSKWSYEDLQRETNRRLNASGNYLYQLVSTINNQDLLDEKDFVDSVSRNLSRGKFLLLIVGDGISEGAAGIAEFLESAGHLNFTFGMVELCVYQKSDTEKIIIPRTIAKTVELKKITIELQQGMSLSYSEETASTTPKLQSYSPEWEKEKQFYTKFWQNLISELVFDDPGQPIPNPATGQNLYIYPSKSRKAWISAYFMKSKNRVGVYFRCQNDSDGKIIYSTLTEYNDDIRNEAGSDAIWSWDDSDIVGYRMPCEDVFNPDNRDLIMEFFKDKINLLVNIFRPRMKDF